ncbi:ligase-associated DNA damage response exonuclease [Gemmobacter sp.]|uniref:ligase-associated DNA damage response exonuclease n=1 Tax=Gemmobacter sp. TaxID=1898957 RepID=UPI002AFF23DA|nr:ligase-associated DNA damage response exonuclease [Gemmobacter sp.]
MARDPVLVPDARGLGCPAGGFHVDPSGKVALAVVTHAHSDHARPGAAAYLATPGTAVMLRQRLGRVQVQELPFGQPLRIGDATVSLHPSGHLPGAAQVRVEVAGEVWVISGDYKTEDDGLAEPFEPVPCHGFVTECTFGLPVFRWAPQAAIATQIRDWWQQAADDGLTAAIAAYSLGKAQRLLHLLAGTGPGPILLHPAAAAATTALATAGYPLPAVRVWDGTDPPPGTLLIAAPQAALPVRSRSAMASGWMALRGTRRGGAGFALSDHADWPGLNAAIRATGASRVLTTHGYDHSFARWLCTQGFDASPLPTASR